MRTHSIRLWVMPVLMLLVLSSCKTKYLEMEARFDKALQKKMELEKENRSLKKELENLSDSLCLISASCNQHQELRTQVIEIEGLKKEFLRSKVPYYLEMKKRQSPPAKPPKK